MRIVSLFVWNVKSLFSKKNKKKKHFVVHQSCYQRSEDWAFSVILVLLAGKETLSELTDLSSEKRSTLKGSRFPLTVDPVQESKQEITDCVALA